MSASETVNIQDGVVARSFSARGRTRWLAWCRDRRGPRPRFFLSAEDASEAIEEVRRGNYRAAIGRSTGAWKGIILQRAFDNGYDVICLDGAAYFVRLHGRIISGAISSLESALDMARALSSASVQTDEVVGDGVDFVTLKHGESAYYAARFFGIYLSGGAEEVPVYESAIAIASEELASLHDPGNRGPGFAI